MFFLEILTGDLFSILGVCGAIPDIKQNILAACFFCVRILLKYQDL
jgi:hypothetical protein